MLARAFPGEIEENLTNWTYPPRDTLDQGRHQCKALAGNAFLGISAA